MGEDQVLSSWLEEFGNDLCPVDLSKEELERLSKAPMLNEYQRQKLDKDAKKNWDLFYKRNGTRFFKNRYWTRHEFHELFVDSSCCNDEGDKRATLFEIGCGCGDFVLPLLQDDGSDDKLAAGDRLKPRPKNIFVYCCDISDQAIEILKTSSIYRANGDRVKAFVADITQDVDKLIRELDGHLVDIVSLVFVLSAIDPDKMKSAIENIHRILKPGGLVLFRDYAIFDKAMLRFHERSKICDQFYVRQDGTRAFFFSKQHLVKLFEGCKFHCQSIDYVKRETINNATKDKFSRIFLQAKLCKAI